MVKKGSFKYFIEYINETDAFPVPLCIKLPQMNGYVKYFDSNNKCFNLLIHDKEWLKKCNERYSIKNRFFGEPEYNDKYIKTKIKIYNNKININFQGNKIPEDNEYIPLVYL